MEGDTEGTGEGSQGMFIDIMLLYRYNIHICVIVVKTKTVN